MTSYRPPLGANVRGPDAWILWQAAHDVLLSRLRQLEVVPYVHRDIVRSFRGTWADLELAARAYRDWEKVRAATESAVVPGGGVQAVLDRPSGLDTAEVAASLGCKERWVARAVDAGRVATSPQVETPAHTD